MAGFQVTEWNHRLLTGLIPQGGICIDATAGTGRDSLFLAQQVAAAITGKITDPRDFL